MENVGKQPQSEVPITNSEEEGRAFAHCQWLYGEGRNRKFCRNPVEPGRDWCRRHMVKVYLPASQHQKALERPKEKLEMNKARRMTTRTFSSAGVKADWQGL